MYCVGAVFCGVWYVNSLCHDASLSHCALDKTLLSYYQPTTFHGGAVVVIHAETGIVALLSSK